MKNSHTNASGVALVEVVLGVAIAGIVVAMIAFTFGLFVSASNRAVEETQALYLAEEGLEILTHLRDTDWDILETDLAVDTTYYLSVATTALDTTITPEVIDGKFTRSFRLSEVERNGNDDIVSSGSVDDGIRFVTMSVEWGTEEVALTSLLANLHEE
ncbi:hypothetical protein N9L26_00565 [Candidatus Pacebacteria bacterium]|nr:hypothetical protein [Candidatus Paceibacterota bacterium]